MVSWAYLVGILNERERVEANGRLHRVGSKGALRRVRDCLGESTDAASGGLVELGAPYRRLQN